MSTDENQGKPAGFEEPGAAPPGSWARALRRPFSSLPARIITSVFATALGTSIVVAYIATQSTEAFLREKIDERFPQVLGRTAQRVDAWYTQREQDLQTFAASGTVVDATDAGAGRRALSEARRYLAYVQEGFPQYRALFILDREGSVRVWVGLDPELPQTLLSRLAASVSDATAREDDEVETAAAVFRAGSQRVQFLSTPVDLAGSAGSLHAMIAVDAIEALLRSDELESTARIAVVGPNRRILADSDGSAGGETIPAVRAGVRDYTDASGEHRVGTTIALPRFGWTLLLEDSYDAAFAPIVSVQRRIVAINIGIVLAFGTLAFLIARSIVQPIRALSEAARRIADGEVDVVLPPGSDRDEIGVLSRVISQMVEKLERSRLEIARTNRDLVDANEELRQGNEVLEQLSFTDGLTRLHNHRYFQDRLRVEERRSRRTGEPLALLLIDIDDFKALNDRWGHAVGDQVLRGVGEVLNLRVRDSDLAARYGGEEFAVIAPATGTEGGLALAEKLRASIAGRGFPAEGSEGPVELEVTASFGVAVYKGDAKELFNAADRALYSAKAAGKNCVVGAWTRGGDA